MNKITVGLTPGWNGNSIDTVSVEICMKEVNLNSDCLIFFINKSTVGIPFLELSKEMELKDSGGPLSYHTAIVEEPHLIREQFIAEQDITGDITLNYEVKLKPVGKNPCFDLGYEEGGMNGSGMTFLPYFPEGKYEITLDWNLEGLPEGFMGVWSFGEGRVNTLLDGDSLAETFYYAGKMDSVVRKNCGFYWFINPELPGREVGEFVMDLFVKMAEFFGDQGEIYQIFSRKLPIELTGRNKMGGTALKRSFQYVYAMEEPPGAAELKFLFPHEIVHNWLQMEDTPFGTCTWYVEGTAEFYSVVLPDRFGILSKQELIKQLNKRAKDYYENPRNKITNAEAGERLFQDGEATLVPYGRGFFYLLHMDEVIRKATQGKRCLDDVVLSILDKTRKGEKCGNDTWLSEVQRIAGIDITEEFKEMQNGRIFEPTVTPFSTPLEIREITGHMRETGQNCNLYEFC